MRNRIGVPLAVSVILASAVTALAPAQEVKGSIPLPALPEQVATNPVTNRVYVATTFAGAEPNDYLSVINGSKDSLITNIQIPPIGYAVAVDTRRNIIYVGGQYLNSDGSNDGSEVVAVSGSTNTVTATISVTSTTSGNGVTGLAVDSATGDVYVANGSDDEVDVIHNLSVSARISAGGTPYGVAVNRKLGTVYASLTEGGVVVIDAKTNTITSTEPFGAAGAGIAVNPANGDVYTTNSVASPSVGQVGVLGSTGSLVATITVGQNPVGIGLDTDENLAYVANTGDDTLSVINTRTNTVKRTMAVSSLFVGVNSNTGKAYIAPQDPVAALTVLSDD